MFERDWFLSARSGVGLVRSYVVVLLIDALLLAALFYVSSDMAWRTAFAMTPHGHTSGYMVAFTYSLFTQVFTMSASGATLASPPTLDWIQVLGAAIVILNGWYLYTAFSKRNPRAAAPEPS